jgi:hypothetical protein
MMLLETLVMHIETAKPARPVQERAGQDLRRIARPEGLVAGDVFCAPLDELLKFFPVRHQRGSTKKGSKLKR